MSGEIVIEKDDPVMELDGDEQALLDEIEVGGTRSFQMGGDNRPSRHPQVAAHDPSLDDPAAFMNPDKRQAPRPQVTTETPMDFGEESDDQIQPAFAPAPANAAII